MTLWRPLHNAAGQQCVSRWANLQISQDLWGELVPGEGDPGPLLLGWQITPPKKRVCQCLFVHCYLDCIKPLIGTVQPLKVQGERQSVLRFIQQDQETVLERELASLAHLVPDKTLTSWFSILQYESFHSAYLEKLWEEGQDSVSSFVTTYIVSKEKCLLSLFCSLWVCPPTVLWQPGLETDFVFIMRSLTLSLRGWNIVLHLSNSKLPAGRNMSKAVL